MEDRISRSTALATRTLEPSIMFLLEFVSFHFRLVYRRFAFFSLFKYNNHKETIFSFIRGGWMLLFLNSHVLVHWR